MGELQQRDFLASRGRLKTSGKGLEEGEVADSEREVETIRNIAGEGGDMNIVRTELERIRESQLRIEEAIGRIELNRSRSVGCSRNENET